MKTITKTTFAKNTWNLDNLTYAYSYRFEETPKFIQLSSCVVCSEEAPSIRLVFTWRAWQVCLHRL